MKFTDLFIKRPVLAIVVNAVIIIAGLQAISSLTVRQYPRSENASIVITTAYIGAGADLVRGFISTPIERVIAAADGLDYVSSESRQNVSIVTARLQLNYDAIRALSEVTSLVNQVRGDLPPEAEIPVITIESADSQFASAYLSFASDFLDENEITDYLVRVVQPRLTAIQGVQKADVLGQRTFAMRVWLRSERLAAFNISPIEVREALAANNYLAAIGATKGSLVQVNLTANTDLRSVEEFQRLVVRSKGGAVVRLSDIADVELGAESYDARVNFTGQTATFIGVWALPNANSLEVIKKVRAELELIKKELPQQLKAQVAYDATEYIQDALEEVVSTLTHTLVIVVVVIFLFLGSLRSVLVPVLAIPVSLIGAVFLMQAFGFTVNLLTLLAIVLSVGLVVDDAIVVVENVERHLRQGTPRLKAAMLGASELFGPVVAMTITLAAVYTPIALQGGLTGSLFREFALTLAGAVTISGIVALTLSPVMSAYILKETPSDTGLAGVAQRSFGWTRRKYERALSAAMRVRPAFYVAWGLLSVMAVAMFMNSASELAPNEDQGIVFGIVETPANATLDQLIPPTREIHRRAMEAEGARFTFQITAPGFSFFGLGLKTWSEREATPVSLLGGLQSSMSEVPGVNTFLMVPPALPGGDGFPIEMVIAGSASDPNMLRSVAAEVVDAGMKQGLFAFPPMIDLKIDQPQAELVFDRDKVAQLGIDLRRVGQEIASAVGGNYVNRFSIGGRSYKVIPQLRRDERLNPEQIADIRVMSGSGELIPVSTFATVVRSTEPRALYRFQQMDSVKISGAPMMPLGKALATLEGITRPLLPPGYTIDYTGQSRQYMQEGNKFVGAFALAVVLIFMVLAVQFNSFRDPLVILAGSVPLAMFGACIFTFLKMPNPMMPFFTDGWTTTINVYSQVGLVTLVGLISKNAILIVEFANHLQEQGQSKIDAIQAAAGIRLRPILMTTFATVFGHIQLTWVDGPGAAARNSIGLVLVTGMAIGTFFTLFFVPPLYVLIAKDRSKARLANGGEWTDENTEVNQLLRQHGAYSAE